MWAVATRVIRSGCLLGWWVRLGSVWVYYILVVIVKGEGAVWRWIGLQCRNSVLTDYRLVCEKLTIFPYAECIVEFCEGVAFLWYSQVQDQIGSWRNSSAKRQQNRRNIAIRPWANAWFFCGGKYHRYSIENDYFGGKPGLSPVTLKDDGLTGQCGQTVVRPVVQYQ